MTQSDTANDTGYDERLFCDGIVECQPANSNDISLKYLNYLL